MRRSELLLLALSYACWPATSGHLTASPWDSCSFVKGYADSHIKCHLSIFCMNCCSLIICSEVDFYLKVRVRECANPASVEVTYGWYGENPAYFKYVFEQSETVRNVSKQSNGDTRRYTGIVARNASHLGLEVYADRDGEDTETLVDPIYFPLHPARCMCESMKAVAEGFVSSYSCTITNDECSELQCTVEDSVLESLTMTISQCDHPPTVTLQFMVNNGTYTMPLTAATSKLLKPAGIIATVGLWFYDYSIDLDIMISNKDTQQQILSKHQIILDLTSCGLPEPFNISTAPHPTIEPTTTESTPDPVPLDTSSQPTANTSLISSVSGTTCNAMQSIADHINNRGTLNLNCTILNCMEIHCVGHNTTLNLSLSCSPVGMTLETADNATVFTQSGLFAGKIEVAVHDYNDTVLGFGLRVWDPVSDVSEDELILNDTLIPLYLCNDIELDSESIASAVIGVVVVVPMMSVTIIIIAVVYLVKRRNYRRYQLHPIVLSSHHCASFEEY